MVSVYQERECQDGELNAGLIGHAENKLKYRRTGHRRPKTFDWFRRSTTQRRPKSGQEKTRHPSISLGLVEIVIDMGPAHKQRMLSSSTAMSDLYNVYREAFESKRNPNLPPSHVL